MAIYATRDIATTTSGELILDRNGDLKLADSPESHVSAANFILRTDNGDYAPDPTLGANLGSFIGTPMTESNLELAEMLATKALTDNVFEPDDVSVVIIPLDINDAVTVVEMGGSFFISGDLQEIEPVVQSYDFPYIVDAEITNQYVTGEGMI